MSRKLRSKTPSESQKLRPQTPSESRKLRPKTPSQSEKLRSLLNFVKSAIFKKYFSLNQQRCKVGKQTNCLVLVKGSRSDSECDPNMFASLRAGSRWSTRECGVAARRESVADSKRNIFFENSRFDEIQKGSQFLRFGGGGGGS